MTDPKVREALVSRCRRIAQSLKDVKIQIGSAPFETLNEVADYLAAIPEPGAGEADEDSMEKISALISRLQSTLDQFGDTCVYIRRGGLSWGAVALNRRDDDKKHGVFDLQAQHDRDMQQRVEQVQRLIADKNRWMERATKAEAAPSPVLPPSGVEATVRLEARPADDSQEWTEIFPVQLEWVAKQGHQVRAIEIAALSDAGGR